MCSLDTAVSVEVATRPGLNPWVDRNEQLFLQDYERQSELSL